MSAWCLEPFSDAFFESPIDCAVRLEISALKARVTLFEGRDFVFDDFENFGGELVFLMMNNFLVFQGRFDADPKNQE